MFSMNLEKITFQSINMEDIEYAEIARMYESANQTMRRPGPVYTIAEDESEDDGTLSNSESRLVAREKRYIHRKTADALMAKYQKMKQFGPKPEKPKTSKTNAPPVTASPAYAIINFSEPKSMEAEMPDPMRYYEATRPVPPRAMKDPKKDIPPEISASIDKTMAEIDALLGQVYTNDKAKPNLLYFNENAFLMEPPKTSTSTSTADDMILMMDRTGPSASPSFLLPLQSSVLGSQLESVRNENEATSPR